MYTDKKGYVPKLFYQGLTDPLEFTIIYYTCTREVKIKSKIHVRKI